MGARLRDFDRQLEAIEAKVTGLFAMVCDDLPAVTAALLNDHNEAAGQLAESEQTINALYGEIEQVVSRAILLWPPVASDLRFLLSVLRIAPELARSHGLVCHIASRAGHIPGAGLSPRCRELTEQMGDLASGVWRRTTDCWCQRDRSAVAALAETNDEMDGLHATLMAELASGHMALPVTMEMTLVARFYQRLGDHAVNVARRVIYLAGSAAA